MLKSKTAAWIAMAIVIVLIAITFKYRTEWWCFTDIFFAFMFVFCHLLALNIVKLSPIASRKLDMASLVFGILAVVSFIVEYILIN